MPERPAISVPSTKAESLALTGDTPMLDAAVSSSLIAKQESPSHDFVKSLDIASTRARQQKQSQKKGLAFMVMPKNSTFGIPPIPSAPPNAGVYWKTATTMKFIPMVVIARKSSFTLRLGRPHRSPTMPTIRSDTGRACQKVRPPAVVSIAFEYAPIPTKAA